ncbi:MAG: hypothetical protein KGS48_15350 [Bacteroidetes bacterium]|nr:hypothetical protein [Bacteroidota bacterium]
MKIRLLGLGLLGLLFAQCNGTAKCKYKPEPIFEQGLPHVLQYNFERDGAQSLESLLLDSGVLLEIGQDVCTSTRQEYRFIVKGDYASFPDSMWIKEASRQMVFLSALSPKHAALKAWADVLEAARPQMKMGEDFEVQSGIKVRIDKVLSPEQSTLVLLFSQE